MEINAQMLLGTKFFLGSKVSSTKNWMKKKNKFGELSTEEIQEITDNKKAIKFGVRIFNGTYSLINRSSFS